jgi:hypothetical protein
MRPRLRKARGETRFSGATRPIKKMGSIAVHTPEPLLTLRACVWADRPNILVYPAFENSFEPAWLDRKASTGFAEIFASGMPVSARAKVTAAIAATAIQIHALL